MRDVFHSTLMCYVQSIEYDFISRTGILRMPSVSCCDMALPWKQLRSC